MGQISSLLHPDVKNVWKAVHPLQNGTSASSYIVPTAKVRRKGTEERCTEGEREICVSGAAHVPTLPPTRSFSQSFLSRASGAHARARTGAAISRLERGLHAPHDRQSAGNVTLGARTRRRTLSGNVLPFTCSRVHAHTQVNLESRQYVIPDEKRRDDVRWQARVMMHS